MKKKRGRVRRGEERKIEKVTCAWTTLVYLLHDIVSDDEGREYSNPHLHKHTSDYII